MIVAVYANGFGCRLRSARLRVAHVFDPSSPDGIDDIVREHSHVSASHVGEDGRLSVGETMRQVHAALRREPVCDPLEMRLWRGCDSNVRACWLVEQAVQPYVRLGANALLDGHDELAPAWVVGAVAEAYVRASETRCYGIRTLQGLVGMSHDGVVLPNHSLLVDALRWAAEEPATRGPALIVAYALGGDGAVYHMIGEQEER